MSSIFRYEPFVALSGNLGWKFLVVDDVLLTREQETCPTISLDKNSIEFKFQTHRNYQLKFVKDPGYETYNTTVKNKETKNSQKRMRQRRRRRNRRLQFLP